MQEILGVTLPYFALILCGFLARWAGIMGLGAPRALNDFVLFFALPALMIRTIGAIPIDAVLRPGFLAAWATVSVGLFLAVAGVSALMFRQPGRVAVLHAATATHGNVGYLGITLVISLMGQTAAAPVAMAIIFDMLVIVPGTITLIEYFGSGGGAAGAKRAFRSAIFNPFMVAIGGGLALSLSGAALPGPVDDFLRVLGMAAVPAALFAIGVTLFGQPLRAAVGEIGALSAIKLILHPVAVLLVATTPAFGLTRAEIAAAVLLSALPVANNVFVIATRYEVRPGRVSSVIFISTVLALASFNLWASLLQAPPP